jgi:molecular chaperone DnaK (HSP70)
MGGEGVPVIPSLIRYTGNGTRLIGQQVIEQGTVQEPETFRLLKHYIINRSPVLIPVQGQNISYLQAGEDFLAAILQSVSVQVGDRSADIAFTVPVETSGHFREWLGEVAHRAGLSQFHIIDEASAAALGYGIPVQPALTYLVFDFGGQGLDITVVRTEDGIAGECGQCRVLGRCREDIGGAAIDQWLCEEVLQRCSVTRDDPAVIGACDRILQACMQTKEDLSWSDRAVLRVEPLTGANLPGLAVTRQEFEDLLDAHGLSRRLLEAIQKALAGASGRGYPEEEIHAVLMVGGSSAIPFVQDVVRRRFGAQKVYCTHPFDAVARGAARFAAGLGVSDHIRNDYAVRHWDARNHRYDYRVIVPAGTGYPAREVARITIRATHDGQRQMGIPLYEREGHARSFGDTYELIAEEGGVRLVDRIPGERENGSFLWVNEESMTILSVNPPAMRGEPRFELVFGIDGNKRLLLTSKDLTTGRRVHNLHPVIRLR